MPVVNAFDRWYMGGVITMTLGGDIITTTGNHPVWVSRGDGLANRPEVAELPSSAPMAVSTGRWVEARHLLQGDTLLLGTGTTTTLAGFYSHHDRMRACNLAVSCTHAYAVGASAVLVHNSCSHSGRSLGDALNLNRTLGMQEMVGEMQAGAGKVIATGKEIDDLPGLWLNMAERLMIGSGCLALQVRKLRLAPLVRQ
jgi:hypothetical protein